MKLRITRPTKPSRTYDVDESTFLIGSEPDCGIFLSEDRISGRHAILSTRFGDFWIEDLQSEHGTFINGARIHGRSAFAGGDVVRVGTVEIVALPGGTSAASPPAADVSDLPPPATQARPPKTAPLREPPPPPPPDPYAEIKRAIKQQVHDELVKRLDIKRLTIANVNNADLTERARATLESIVKDAAPRLPAGVTPAQIAEEVFNEALRLGPLEQFLADADISEIMVNGPDQVYVERQGRLDLTAQRFMNDNSVLAIIERIVSPLGRRVDESQPYVDARLPDGSRVNAIIHPLSLIGPCLTIRKFSKIPFSTQDLIRFGTMTSDIADFIRVCVRLRKNIVVSGGTGSGKTSLLNVFSGYLPETERILTIEDAAELRLAQPHVIRLEARPPNIEGKGAVTIRDLVRNALRMRPDRIVVGECRGGEALDMLQAMNTGHDGSLTTVHANSPRDVIARLETMVLMSGMDLPVRAIREQIAAAIELIVHEARFSDGSRKVTKVTEVVGLEGDQITMQDIFEFVQEGIDDDGRIIGRFRPTGAVPTFVETIAAQGLSLDRSMFDPRRRGGG